MRVPPARLWLESLVAAFAAALMGLGCAADSGDPGSSWRGFETSFVTSAPPRAVLVLVVDDRSTAAAAELRAGIGAAMRQLGSAAVQEVAGLAPDWAAWHPIDVTVMIVPGAGSSAVIGPASDGRLAWKTNQATPQSADDLAAAVEEQVRRLAAPEDAPFLPLARAHAVVDILTRTQSPPRRIGVAVVATTDDQSPGPTKSYHLPPDVTTIGLAPSRRDAHGEIDPVVYPRLIDWSDGMLGSPFNPLERLPDAPYSLFESRWTGEWTPRCPGYAIAESSPGLGRCVIEMTTSDPLTCDPERGWVDPLASNGSRRPRVTQKGERICEIAPVDPRVMDACIHDETCPDCGAGWCITQFLPLGKFCPDRAPLPIRWVGGAVPSPGVVHITCLEPVDSAAH